MQPFKRLFKIHPLNIKIEAHSVNDQRREQLEELFYKTIKPWLIVAQIFLSAPLGAHKPRWLMQPIAVIFSRLHMLWSLVVHCSLALCVYLEYIQSNIELPIIQKPFHYIEYLIYVFHLLELIRMINTKRGAAYWQLQRLIIDFDRDLQNLKLPTDYNDLQRFIRRHMVLILLQVIFAIINSYFFSHSEIISFFRNNFMYVLPNVIIYIALVQYYALLFVIHKRSEKLYGLLDNLLNRSYSADLWSFRQELHFIRSFYARLEEFTKMVNDNFSFTILLVYFGAFINLSFNLFMLYKYLTEWKTSDLAWTIGSFAWVCMHFGKMLFILQYNHNIQNMKNAAMIMLTSFKFEHQTVEPALRHFILQLISDTRSNVVCGIVTLNMNILTSLLVAVSTLFIFLVQYNITHEALAKMHNSRRSNLYYNNN